MADMDIGIDHWAIHAPRKSVETRILACLELILLKADETQVTAAALDQRQCQFSVDMGETGMHEEGTLHVDPERVA